MEGYLSCFIIFVITNTTVVNILVHTSLFPTPSIRQNPGSRLFWVNFYILINIAKSSSIEVMPICISITGIWECPRICQQCVSKLLDLCCLDKGNLVKMRLSIFLYVWNNPPSLDVPLFWVFSCDKYSSISIFPLGSFCTCSLGFP